MNISSRSSLASSFDRLDVASTENEVVKKEEEIEDISDEEDSEYDEYEGLEQENEKLREKLAALELQCEKQRSEIVLMDDERKALRKDAMSDANELQRALEGNWKFESSSDMTEFVRIRDASTLEDVLLHVAEQNIEFGGDSTVTLFDSVSDMRFNLRSGKLGETCFDNGCALMTFISGGVLKTRRIQMGEELNMNGYEEWRHIEDGKLHVKTNMYGRTITRVYTRNKHATDVCGLWQQIGKTDRKVSMELADGKFYRKTYNDNQKEKDSEVFTVNGGEERGWVTSVRGFVLVQEQVAADGEVLMTRKRYVENGKLVSFQQEKGKSDEKWMFERVGEPLPHA